MADESYENFYPGTLSPLDPYPTVDSGDLFVGYRVPFSAIGATTNPQTANIITEVSDRLSQGIRVVEAQPISPEVFESIPKQHFKEVERISKLTGADITLHAPIVEPSGFTKQGWSENERQDSERMLKMAIDRAHEMNPRGGVPVTIHASSLPGTEWDPSLPEDKRMVVAYDKESQQLVPLKYERKYYPGHEEKGYEFTPEDQLHVANNTHWQNNVMQLFDYKKKADEMIEKNWLTAAPIWDDLEHRRVDPSKIDPGQLHAYNEVKNALIFYRDQIDLNIKSMYNEAYQFAPKKIETAQGTITKEQIRGELKKIGERWEQIQPERTKYGEIEKVSPSKTIEEYNKILHTLRSPLFTPEHYVPLEEFAQEHSAKTFANTALHGFLQYGENAPTVSIENVFPNTAFGRAESLKRLIKAARKEFINQAKKKGIGETGAKQAAEKLIGATWDVGHINLLRKHGYKKAKIAEETKEIAPFVKHVHITDNFGFNDVHLPPGMGDVPIKDILRELEKKGYSGKQIIEAGGFLQHFKTSPMPTAFEALGSPIYGMTQAPYWNQIQGIQGQYMAGPYAVMPPEHFSLYGGGFSSLPTELGGQVPGKQSRFSGTPTS